MSVRKTVLDGVLYAGALNPPQGPHQLLQLTVLRQYKDLLIQTKYLFDDNAKKYVAARIRQRFRDNMLPQGSQRIQKLLKDGRRWLSILERANLGDIKAIDVILNHTYARIGRRRHEILDDLTRDKYLGPRLDRWRSFLATEKNIDTAKIDATIEKYTTYNRIGQPRAPPDIPPAVQELMKKDPNVQHNPNPEPMSLYRTGDIPLKRQINMAWKHYSQVREKLSAPLPREEVQFLVRMAHYGLEKPFVKTDFLKKIEERRKLERQITGRFRGNFHQMDRHFIQRRYQDLLTRHYVPMLEQLQGGKWKVRNAGELIPPMWRVIPEVDPRHRQGVLVKGGKRIKEVNAKGEYINPQGSR